MRKLPSIFVTGVTLGPSDPWITVVLVPYHSKFSTPDVVRLFGSETSLRPSFRHELARLG